MAGEFVDERLRILKRSLRLNLEGAAHAFGHNLGKRRVSVRCLPDCGGNLIQSEEGGICGGHDHHLASQQAGGNR